MKTWLSALFRRDKKVSFPVVWDSHQPSIYQWLSQWEEETDVLPDEAQTLPDEQPQASNEISWAAGALDGVLGHHLGASQGESLSVEILHLLTQATQNPDNNAVAKLYALVKKDSPLSYIDDLLPMLVQLPESSVKNLQAFAVWLATNAPDRNPVKFAIALLGYFPSKENARILQILGSHDEFALYAIVALGKMLPAERYDEVWLEMAKKVDGWGRIHLIEHLYEEVSPAIADWLLRTGYSNSVMNEYTAWQCAEYGQLDKALQGKVDDELLAGAGQILDALIQGGPSRDIHDYDAGAVACQRYLERVSEKTATDLLHYEVAHNILYLAQHGDFGTPTQKANLRILAQQVMEKSEWDVLIQQGLADKDNGQFYSAIRASRLRAQDPWPAVYARQSENPDESLWYHLMQTDNPDFIERTIALAQMQLDLNAIASGADKQLGLGSQYSQHSALNFILQDLNRFPGKGWALIQAGLQSPVIRNRHMALKALQAWPEENWTEEMTQLINQCRQVEPDDDVRQRMVELTE